MRIVRRSFGRLIEALPSQVYDRLDQRYGHHALPDLRPHLGPTPWAPLRRPLSEATVGLFTTAGIHLRSQPGFTSEPDPTWRVIPAETPDADLLITHDHYDHQDADCDPGIVFPLNLLRRVSGNLIGRPAAEHYGMMGFWASTASGACCIGPYVSWQNRCAGATLSLPVAPAIQKHARDRAGCAGRRLAETTGPPC